VASDHGEGLGEHQETLHGFFVYQTTLAVPIVLRGPGIARGGRIDRTVGLVDLVPTALDLLGVAVPQGFHPSGNSLAPTLRGGAPPPEAPQYAESLVPLLHFGWSDLRVLRRGSWKYVLAPTPELYDLSSDPHEQRNVAEEHPDRTAAFRRTLTAILDQERRSEGTRAAEALPVDLIERLGALGYVSGNDSTAGRSSGADPKDKILEFRRANEGMRSGIVALNRHDFEASARAFEALIGGGIESFEVHLYLARSYAGMKRADRAAAHFEQAARRAPLLEEAWTGWAEARLATHGPQAALAIVRDGRKQNPKSAQLAALDGTLCVRLGEIERDRGHVDAALASFRHAVAADPTSAPAWNALGMTLGGNGHLAEAEQAFRSAIARDSSNHRYFFNLGLALVRQGRGADARPYFEKSLQLAPGFEPAREELQRLGVDHTGR
jgi:tetratricopeptide (TPR) repeat protein